MAKLTYTAIVTDPPGLVLHNRALVDDGLGNTIFLDAVATIKNPIFLPIVLK